MKVALIDYRAGNLTSVRKALSVTGADFFTPESAADLDGADAVIVPGVGHFNATANLDEGWRQKIRALVSQGRPLLGICLGLQFLFEGSEEAPELPGLGLLAGQCHYLRADALKVPHVGWNSLEHVRVHPLFSGIKRHVDFYFVHSYHCLPSDPADIVARCDYGGAFVAAVARANVAGTQFHPEKSQPSGLGILENFAAWDPTC